LALASLVYTSYYLDFHIYIFTDDIIYFVFVYVREAIVLPRSYLQGAGARPTRRVSGPLLAARGSLVLHKV
jgi:hypothetical protein